MRIPQEDDRLLEVADALRGPGLRPVRTVAPEGDQQQHLGAGVGREASALEGLLEVLEGRVAVDLPRPGQRVPVAPDDLDARREAKRGAPVLGQHRNASSPEYLTGHPEGVEVRRPVEKPIDDVAARLGSPDDLQLVLSLGPSGYVLHLRLCCAAWGHVAKCETYRGLPASKSPGDRARRTSFSVLSTRVPSARGCVSTGIDLPLSVRTHSMAAPQLRQRATS